MGNEREKRLHCFSLAVNKFNEELTIWHFCDLDMRLQECHEHLPVTKAFRYAEKVTGLKIIDVHNDFIASCEEQLVDDIQESYEKGHAYGYHLRRAEMFRIYKRRLICQGCYAGMFMDDEEAPVIWSDLEAFDPIREILGTVFPD